MFDLKKEQVTAQFELSKLKSENSKKNVGDDCYP